MNTQNIRYVLVSFVIALSTIGGAVSVTYAQGAPVAAGNAAAVAALTYPIAALGSCKDKQDCKKYCDDVAHMTACVAFAEKQGLLTGDELRVSKVVAEKVAAKATPGGCTTTGQCEAYCNGNVAHLNECVAFGEQLGVIAPKDLAEAKKVASALAKGASMPGSCKTKSECENYCAAGTHIDECLNFAEAAGMISGDDLAQARKVAPFLKSGEMPGKCSTKAECEAYCADTTHFEACLGFAEKVGFVSADDAAMARKTGGKGPGSCTSKDSCAAYCNDESHATECLAFAKEKGLLTAEQQTQIDTGMDQLKAGLDKVPAEARAEVTTCLENAVGGKDKLDRLLSKQDTPTQAMGDKFQGCFANIGEIMQKAMTAKFKQQAPQGTGAPSGAGSEMGAPKPTDIRAQMEQEARSSMQGGPVPAPGQQSAPSAAGAPSGSAPTQGMGAPSAEMCAAFAGAPSCDYVPAGQARDLCLKCK